MITIVIADDELLIREGLKTILNLESDFEVIGLARNGEEACQLVKELRPMLIMMDIQMPVMDGITALKEIQQFAPETNVLILSTFLEDQYIIEGMANGARGYLLKDMETDKMIAAIRDTVIGQFILPTVVASKLAKRMSQMAIGHTADFSATLFLTEREKTLAELLIKGYSNRKISATLHIAEGTTRNYISNLYTKLDVENRAQAIARLQELL